MARYFVRKEFMTVELIISISGMRGIIGSNLTAAIAAEYACAFGTFLKRNNAGAGKKLSVCLGRDSRPSGEMLAAAVTAGLSSAGVDVIELGLVSTPGVGLMTTRLGAAGGVVITASHNPIEYNGIKFLLGNGIAPAADTAKEIRRIYFDKDFDLADSVDCGGVEANNKTDSVHIEKVLATVERDAIARKKFKVVLDSVNGAGGNIGKGLLGELGCEVVAVNDEPTGLFAHTPEPTKENLGGLCEEVKKAGADVGFAQDPDADRLAIVDENGVYIGEEYTVALAAKYVYSMRTGKSAANLSTSRMIDDIAEAGGGEVIRTPVGEAHVANAMIENGCIIGGEGNGGVIDLRVGPVRDSLVAIGLVLGLMAKTGKKVSELASEIGGYRMEKVKFEATREQAQVIIDEAKKVFAGAKVDSCDGARFDLDDGWVHIRSSNTEPIMRVIVETQSSQATQKYIDMVAAIRDEKL